MRMSLMQTMGWEAAWNVTSRWQQSRWQQSSERRQEAELQMAAEHCRHPFDSHNRQRRQGAAGEGLPSEPARGFCSQAAQVAIGASSQIHAIQRFGAGEWEPCVQLPRCGRFGPSSTGTDFKLRHHGRAYAVGTRRSTASPPLPPSPSRRRSRRRRSRPARAAPCRLPGRGLIACTMATVVVEEAPGASAHSSVLTLVNSSIGAGILALPLAFSCTGWAGGLAAVAFIACTEGFTLYVLARCAESTGARTYGGLVRAGGAAPTQSSWGQHPLAWRVCLSSCPALRLALGALHGHAMPRSSTAWCRSGQPSWC